MGLDNITYACYLRFQYTIWLNSSNYNLFNGWNYILRFIYNRCDGINYAWKYMIMFLQVLRHRIAGAAAAQGCDKSRKELNFLL